MTDGARLRASWAASLAEAESTFRALSSSATSWQRVPLPRREASALPTAAAAVQELPDAVVHKRPGRRGDMYRVVVDVALDDADAALGVLDAWRAVLAAPELRRDWDPAVEGARLVEMFDLDTRIVKTNFTLGWPASPRDAITINRTFRNAHTLIDIATSLPRSPDEPAYLRPAPPYVRSHIQLFAWCIQLPNAVDPGAPKRHPNSKLRVSCFWQHDLKAGWALGVANLSQQLPAMMHGLIDIVRQRGRRVPILSAFGTSVGVENITFDVGRESLVLEYHIIPDDDDGPPQSNNLDIIRTRKRLQRAVECLLPAPRDFSWDMQLTTQAPSNETATLPWTVQAIQASAAEAGRETGDYIFLTARHSPVPSHHIVKVKLAIERAAPSSSAAARSGLRLNGAHHPVEDVTVSRDPTVRAVAELEQDLLKDAQSMSGISMNTVDTAVTSDSASTMSARPGTMIRSPIERALVKEKRVLNDVRRNYIYFSSLLQEPEAKWKRNTEARGVTITQLDSIDPTLIVYRAEAVFVGIGLWDLYSAITSPGTRPFWDRTHEDALLLDDVNELTELWYNKTKAAWPVNARDCVLLRTVYKSPTTIHVFAFSTEDNMLFPNIPSSDPTTIRMQVDLQGWAIESLSPTTTALTLLEQSDPKGWSNKSSIPQQMISTVSGVGEFAIKSGGAPVLSRLGGARKTALKYDHEKGTFRVEYERREPPPPTPQQVGTPPGTSTTSLQAQLAEPRQMQYIECEIRCDLDTWAPAVDVVVDPPPQRVSCLRRHRLSGGGGGLWLTIEHDAAFAGDERLAVIVRKAGKEAKSAVVLNGSKIKVDVEELPESEIKNLTKQKRVKPERIPLDQPPVLNAIKRRRDEWADSTEPSRSDTPAPPERVAGTGSTPASPSTTRFAVPFTRYLTLAVEQATGTTNVQGADAALSPDVHPMKYAADKLAWLRRHHAKGSEHVSAPGPWTALTEKAFTLHRAMDANISNVIAVHRAEKVFPGASAEEVASALTNYDCRRQWDTRFDSAVVLEEYGSGCHTAFVVSRGGYMFRDRGFYTATITARLPDRDSSRRNTGQSSASTPDSTGAVIFHLSTSFAPESASRFDAAKYNRHALPIGRLLVEGWILETLDPYTAEAYPIPSTRCTHLVAIDFAGSVPVAMNTVMNASLPRAILALEAFVLKANQPPILRLPGLGVNVSRVADEEGEIWAVDHKDRLRASVASRFSASGDTLRATLLIRANGLQADSTAKADAPSPFLDGGGRHLTRDENMSTATVRRATISTARDAALSGMADPDDMLVAEAVIDLRVYKEGYAVTVSATLRPDGTAALEPIALGPLHGASVDTLPIACHVFTLPPSPLTVSSDRKAGMRHLLRFTLRTAQYDAPAMEDPLTGEHHIPPPRPKWLSDLEERGAALEITIKPRPGSGVGSKVAVVDVPVNDGVVAVLSEKESLNVLGRRELEEDRLRTLPVLSRVAMKDGMRESEVSGLSVPIAIASDLLAEPEPEIKPVAPVSGVQDTADAQKSVASSGVTVETAIAEPRPYSSPRSASVLNNILTNYSSWLGSSGLLRGTTPATGADVDVAPIRTDSPEPIDGAKISLGNGELKAAPADEASGTRPRLMRRLDAPSVSLWTLLVVSLLSFLLGSFLRSLVVPADYVYLPPEGVANVGSDGQSQWSELQRLIAMNHREDWKEMKRLIEFRGPFGRWDIVLAVIRRR